ncbi:MAG: oxidoreductase [Sphingobacteriia bacterium]
MKKQIVFITGASSGIGKETALKLLQEGHTVYGAARRIDKMQALTDAGGYALQMDILQAQQVQAAVDKIIEAEGRIDVLINNAGYAVFGAVEDVSAEDTRRQFDVNLFGLAEVTKQVLPHMRRQKSGRILNISSMGGKLYSPLGAWYHATKHALEGWSDCLRLETKQFGIDVVIIEPGIIKTELGDVMLAPMLERSGKGPYAGLAQKLALATDRSYSRSKNYSPASVIAQVISKAIRARKPKTRYAKGKYAKPLMWMRLYLVDRLFDKVVMSQFQLK